MDPDSLAALITACTAFIVAMGGLLGIVMPKLRAQDRAVEAVASEVTQVHTIVNQQRTDAQNYAAALVAALHDAGVDVPLDQSLTFAPAPPQGNIPADASPAVSGRFQMDSPVIRPRS